MPESVEGSSPYLPGLDGIRAIAVLAVLAYHLNFGWAAGGLLGVGMFFVLSGYLITDLLVVEFRQHQHIDFKKFWIRRARRLLPALFLMLFVLFGWVTLFDRAQLPMLRGDLPAAIFYYSNWWFIFQHISYFARFGQPSPVGHLWSLAIEEQFYLLWPIIVFAGLRWIRSRGTLIVTLLIAAVASAVEMGLLYVPFQDPTRVYDGTDTRAFALLIGAVLALVWPRELQVVTLKPSARWVLELVGGASLIGIFALIAATNEYESFLYRGGIVLSAILTAAIIVVTIHPGARLKNLLGIAPLRWIGRRSYGIYLWHYPIIVLTTPLNSSPNLVRITLQISASFFLAALSWRYLEEPIRHGALLRLWSWVRARDWSRLRPGPFGYGLSIAVLANGVICTIGLVGFVAVPAIGPASQITNILPAIQHHSTTAPSVSSATKPITTTTVPKPTLAGSGVTAIGDSIMIDAAPYLRHLLPGIIIDAQIGQQLYQLLPTVPKLKAGGVIGNRVIIELGTNGSYSKAQLDELLNSLGPPREIVLVNTLVARPWEAEVNETIAAVAKGYPHVTVVNWYTLGAVHPNYFYPDGVHLNPEGASYYASLLAKALEAGAPRPVVKPHRAKHTAKKRHTKNHREEIDHTFALKSSTSNNIDGFSRYLQILVASLPPTQR